jgi:beta-mannosidase
MDNVQFRMTRLRLKYKWIVSLVAVCQLFVVNCAFSQKSFSLNGNWEFKQSGKTAWYPATVPGVVHTDLLENKLIEDPFWENNELKLQWIEEKAWEYKRSFSISKEQLNHDFAEIKFEGLDTYAQVFINDSLVLKMDNMFRTWSKPVKNFLKEGENEILVRFTPPIYGARAYYSREYDLPAGCESVDIKVSPYVRKAAYHFGWDWGPRFVTCGIWRDVYVNFWNEGRIENVFVHTKYLSENSATLGIEVNLDLGKNDGKDYQIRFDEVDADPLIKVIGKSRRLYSKKVQNPKLWWCNGEGEQNLQTMKVEMLLGGKVIDTKEVTFGVRTIELINESDSIGTSFYFKLNGKPVFMKGGNYIPQDVFLPRVTDDQYRKLIQQIKDANMNMIRVWGGGVYEKDLFYKLCDENGILVWQDFMFAGTMIPPDKKFFKNVSREISDNIIRLRNHPSIAIWCGNNEMKVAWNNWGWQKQYNWSSEDSTAIWLDYIHLFEEQIPQLLESYDPSRDYTPTSPLSNWGKAENFNHSSMHYWGVWHGKEMFEEFEKNVGRFMVEYGFQSFPSMKTIRKFASDSSLNLSSETMLNRQKSYIGNKMIWEMTKHYIGTPNSFEEFVEMSQQTQALALEMAIKSHLRKQPHCMGTLFWQLNDCWPGPSWSIIDYYGEEKKAYGKVKELFGE